MSGPAAPLPLIVLFLIANLGFELSLGVYNGFLPEIANEENMGRVSAFGFALGWFFGRMGCTVAHDHPGIGIRGDSLAGPLNALAKYCRPVEGHTWDLPRWASEHARDYRWGPCLDEGGSAVASVTRRPLATCISARRATSSPRGPAGCHRRRPRPTCRAGSPRSSRPRCAHCKRITSTSISSTPAPTRTSTTTLTSIYSCPTWTGNRTSEHPQSFG